MSQSLAPLVIVEVRGGMVQAVYTEEDLAVVIVDHDTEGEPSVVEHVMLQELAEIDDYTRLRLEEEEVFDASP